MATDTVWVFNGEGGTFPSGAFRNQETAENWIRKYGLSGVLTEYPLDVGVYDWVVDNGYFAPKYPSQKEAAFIGKFSSAYLQHHHYENGVER
jgi:hypothetical protein